jgi:hypothetical protein
VPLKSMDVFEFATSELEHMVMGPESLPASYIRDMMLEQLIRGRCPLNHYEHYLGVGL